MSVAQQAARLINNLSVDFYGGWSIMDIFWLGAALVGAGVVLDYFFNTAGKA